MTLSRDSTSVEVLEAWATRLEANTDQQTSGVLRRTMPGGEPGYCCLGVLSEMAVEAGVIGPAVARESDCDCDECQAERNWYYGKDGSFPPAAVIQWAFGGPVEDNNPVLMSAANGDNGAPRASYLNDILGWTFPEIGSAVRKSYLEGSE